MVKIIEEDKFKEKFNKFIPELTKALTIPDSPDWTVKGFIDYYNQLLFVDILKPPIKILPILWFYNFIIN